MSKLDAEAFEKIAAIFRALSEPMRLAILQELKSGPKTVGALAEAITASQANVSKHLKVMHDAHLLSREKQGTSVFYSIETDLAIPLCELVCLHLNTQGRARPFYYVI